MNGVSCPGNKKSCDMATGLATCVCLFLEGGKGEVLDHNTAVSLRCILTGSTITWLRTWAEKSDYLVPLLPSCITVQPGKNFSLSIPHFSHL